jgi:hypothetical protein
MFEKLLRIDKSIIVNISSTNYLKTGTRDTSFHKVEYFAERG